MNCGSPRQINWRDEGLVGMAGNLDGMTYDGVPGGPILDNRKIISSVSRSNAQARYASNWSHNGRSIESAYMSSRKALRSRITASPYNSALLLPRGPVRLSEYAIGVVSSTSRLQASAQLFLISRSLHIWFNLLYHNIPRSDPAIS